MVDGGSAVITEINGRDVSVAGLYELGTSFGIDGSIVTSDLNFRRIFSDRSASRIELGLVTLDPGADAFAVRDSIVAGIPGMSSSDPRRIHPARVDYWSNNTPIGYVFGLGVAMGLAVGLIVVYQILFSDVQDHLREYATMKAMGYSHFFSLAPGPCRGGNPGGAGVYRAILPACWCIRRPGMPPTCRC